MKRIFVFVIFIACLGFIKNVDAIYIIEEDVRLKDSANYVIVNIDAPYSEIRDIEPLNGWEFQGSNASSYKFAHNGVAKTGDVIARFTVGAKSENFFPNFSYSMISIVNSCKIVNNHFWGPTGEWLDASSYKKSCYPTDATLKSLQANNGKLSPNFSSDVLQYSTKVANEVSKINFTAITNDSKAKVLSGTTCNLNVGVNRCAIVIEAQNGDTKTYTIDVTREEKPPVIPPLSTDATISSLVVKNATLVEPFQKDRQEYTIKVLEDVNDISFDFVTNSDQKSHTVTCSASNTYCDIIVTAEDGINKNTYRFNIQIVNKEIPVIPENPENPENPTDPDKDSEGETPHDPTDESSKNDQIGNSEKDQNWEDDSLSGNYEGVENPETGDYIKTGTFVISLILIIGAVLLMKKKGIFQKL